MTTWKQFRNSPIFINRNGLLKRKIKSTNSFKPVNPSLCKNDRYYYFRIQENGLRNRYYLHRAVAELFLGSVENKIVHHIDENKLNNCCSNLEILDSPTQHKHKHSIVSPRLTKDIVTDIRYLRYIRKFTFYDIKSVYPFISLSSLSRIVNFKSYLYPNCPRNSSYFSIFLDSGDTTSK